MIADNAFTDKIGQHPVGTVYRSVGQCFLYIIICKRYVSTLAIFKIRPQSLGRSMVVKIGVLHSLKKIVLTCQTTENHICQSVTVMCVDIAEGGIIVIRL